MSSLFETPVGRSFLIQSLDEKLGKEFRKDLLDYGLLPGSQITLSKKFPRSEKIIVQLARTKIALHTEDAKKIYGKIL
ncbi:MAG: ferrous iron transport protein A [Leptospiraceae bacterium]|nr:ferrous iron transport protein A [Leptospiraceae bacterium]